MNKKKLYIIRGLPSSGKTTLANEIADFVCEADMYFYNNGVYVFKAEQLQQAHLYCQHICRAAMQEGFGRIAVSNTFTTEKEMLPYVEMAEQFGYDVTYIIVEGRHGNKNDHNVPDEVVNKMRSRFQIKL